MNGAACGGKVNGERMRCRDGLRHAVCVCSFDANLRWEFTDGGAMRDFHWSMTIDFHSFSAWMYLQRITYVRAQCA